MHSHRKHEIHQENPRKAACDASGFVEATEETGNYFQNRILTCIVTSPVGRSLHTYQSLTELLCGICDAIKCHRSLYRDAKILHQDISPGNIILLDSNDEGQPKGTLIDLDSAVELREGSGDDSGITGTRPFMAIGVLKGEHHTYRHDLESFFYVLLWEIITNHAEDPPQASKLRRWSNGDWDELALRKATDMNSNNFDNILEEFPPKSCALKPLAISLHQLLFPLRDGLVSTGTVDSLEAVDIHYDGIIHAIEEAISSGVVDSLNG